MDYFLRKQPPSLAATEAVQQQRYNGSRALCSRLCASSHGVCVCGWCTTARDQTTATQSLTHLTQQTHIVGPHTRHTKHTTAAKSVLLLLKPVHVIGTLVFPLFDLRRSRDIKYNEVNRTPKVPEREPCTY